MQASSHKKLILAGCGCAAFFGVLTLLGLVIALKEDPDFFRTEFVQEQSFAPARARAALDSLEHLDFGIMAHLPAKDRWALPVRDAGDGATAAVAVWTDSAFALGFVTFADTLPPDDRDRRRWTASADWEAVDSLRAAALRSWNLDSALVESDTSGHAAVGLLIPTRVLGATRAVLSRARRAAEEGNAAEADTLARAAVTVGRRLQRDYRLHHVLLGARIEAEAFRVLPGAGGAAARADSAVAALGRVYRSFALAGALAEQCADLVALARDAELPLAARHEAVLAIGYGWVFAAAEQVVVDGRREAALADLAADDLPDQLREAVRAGRHAVARSLWRRFDLAALLRVRWNAWRWAG